MRKKIMLGGYETWIELLPSSCIALFGSETAKNGVYIDVMGSDNNRYIPDGYLLTEEEKKELVKYFNENLEVSN